MKNRDKYMKEIYQMIPNEELANLIGVNKTTGKPFICSKTEIGDCDNCLFCDNNECNISAILDWINQEEK